MKIKTTPIQVTTKKFLTWDEANSLKWGRYNNRIRFLAQYGLRWSRPPPRIKEIHREKMIYIAKKSISNLQHFLHFLHCPMM